MKFKLTVINSRYDKCNAWEMVEMDKLKRLGFTFTDSFTYLPNLNPKTPLFFIINGDDDKTIEINTLEQLIGFIKKYGKIIVKEDTIEIYNGYRE